MLTISDLIKLPFVSPVEHYGLRNIKVQVLKVRNPPRSLKPKVV